MKLLEAIKNEKGNPYWISDCSRSELPELFKELGFKVGAEIGVKFGVNLEGYCKEGFKMYGVDSWTDDHDGIYNNYSNMGKVDGKLIDTDEVYALAVERLSPYPNCTLVRKRSLAALRDFPRRSLDFVYIDANHMYGYAAMDIMAWSDKVKRGGVVAVHDYHRVTGSRSTRQVGPAIDGYVKSSDINNWYVLGGKEFKRGEKNDNALTCMFFKHW